MPGSRVFNLAICLPGGALAWRNVVSNRARASNNRRDKCSPRSSALRRSDDDAVRKDGCHRVSSNIRASEKTRDPSSRPRSPATSRRQRMSRLSRERLCRTCRRTVTATPGSARSYGNESAISVHVLSVQVATVPNDREPHRAANHRIPDEEDRRPRCRAGGTVPGGLRDVHVSAAAW